MWYNVGTVTVTSGSPIVDGAGGVDFVNNCFPGDAFIGPNGLPVEILRAETATRLILARPYAGQSGGGQTYAIQPTQDYLRSLTAEIIGFRQTYAGFRDTILQGSFGDGAVAAPGIRFTADQDTGLRRVGANILAVVAGGSDALVINTGTRVEVKAAHSSLMRLFNESGPGTRLLFSDNQWAAEIEHNSGNIILKTGGTTEAMRIGSSGNVGIGTPAPAARLHIRGDSTTLRVESANAGATDTQIALATRERQWNIGQNVGASGVGTLNIFDVSAGALRLLFATDGAVRPGIDNAQSFGTGGFRWSVIYSGTGSINTSDKREKKDIGAIPAEWLDAWGDVQWQRFRFRDAVKAKGEEARWHLGLIAQQVQEAFAARGLDAREIGLLCHDEWEATPAVKEVQDDDGEIVTHAQPARKAGDRWGLRYDECQAIEAAWQRRRIAELEAAVAALAAQHG